MVTFKNVGVRLLVFLLGAALFYPSFGCGGGGLSATDQKLAGQWVAQKLNQSGVRVLLVFGASAADLGYGATSAAERTVAIVAIRPAGDTMTADQGSYSIDGNRLAFDLNEIADFSSSFTVTDTQLTLGTEVYDKVTGSMDGPRLGGQIQVVAAPDEAVTVSSLSVLSSGGPHFVPGELIIRNKNAGGGPAALTVSGGTSSTKVPYQVVKINLGEEPPPALSAQGGEEPLTDKVFRRVDRYDRLVKATLDRKRELEVQGLAQGFEVGLHRILKARSLAAPTDTFFDEQWNLDLLNITEAWQKLTPVPANEAVVAVIDTGIVNHPDLAGLVLNGDCYDFVHWKIDGIPDLSMDGDGPDGDCTDPGDHQDMGLPGGSSWHGTHIAGIIAAGVDNATGIAGIAGVTSVVKILPLRAMGWGGNGTLDDVAQAIRYAAKLPNIAECEPFTAVETGVNAGTFTYNEGTWTCTIDAARPRADVINLSLGAPMTAVEAGILNDAVNEAYAAGVTIVAAAGNEAKGPGWCLNDAGTAYVANPACAFYPAANPNVLSIGAVYPSLGFASAYSNYGATPGNTQFLAAPGGGGSQAVLSTVHPSVLGGYGELMGTSQAAAHVSAAAAILISDNPGLTNVGVKAALQTSAIDLGPTGQDIQFGYGLVNPCGAIMIERGTAPSGPAALSTSASSVNFGSLGTQATVVFSHSCGAPAISITGATESIPSGGNWLDSTIVGSQTPARLNLTVNRAGLAVGDYTATVTVATSAGSQPISIAMTVGTASTSGASGSSDLDDLRQRIEDLLGGGGVEGFENTIDMGEVIVLLIDSESGEARYYTRTDFSANYNFQFGGIAAGDYYLIGGVDENLDGTICAAGSTELCFGYPNMANPEAINVTSSTQRNDLVLTY